MQDSQCVLTVLQTVENYLKNRHHVIHSILISKSGGDIIMQKNRRTKTDEQVNSKEIIGLANGLYELQKSVDGLKFPVRRLIDALRK